MTAKKINKELEKGKVFLDAERYELEEPLFVPSRSGIIGGAGVVLVPKGNFSAVIVEGEEIILDSFRVEVEQEEYSSHAIFIKDSRQVAILGVAAFSRFQTRNAGICLYRCSDVVLKQCEVENFRFGMFLTTSIKRTVVSSCSCFNCPTGLYVYGAEGICNWIEIMSCEFRDKGIQGESGMDGILLDRCTDVFLYDNLCVASREHGIYLSKVERGIVARNDCLASAINGIQMIATDGVIVKENTCSYNIGNGIYMDRCRKDVIDGNSCMFNGRWGILEVNSDYSSVMVRNATYENSLGNLHRE